MKNFSTLTLAATLALATLSAQAQITLDGTISAAEIGTGAGKYVSLGKFNTSHTPVAGGPTGFGNAGLLQLYGANSNSKLYVGIAGSIEAGGNCFQLWMDLPGRTGVPAGTPLPSIAGATTVFGTFAGGSIGGTKMDQETDAAIALTGQGDVQAAIYTSATAGAAKSLGGGAAITTDGTPNTLAGTTGAYAIFRNARVAEKFTTGGLSNNPGNATTGGAGSDAVEYEFDNVALGLPSGASIVRLMVAYVSGDAYWSSDVIPEIPNNGLNNLGFSPDFTALAGTQSAALGLVVLSTRQADEAVVALSVFPNPSEGASTVTYQVANGTQPVAVQVLDLLGRPVQNLLSASQNTGIHNLSVPAGTLAVGNYLVKVQVGDRVATRRLTVTQ